MAGELQLKTLGELCRFSGGAGFPQRLQGGCSGEFPFIKVSDMELPGNAFRITKANNWIDESTRRELRAKAHPPNSTVFAKIGVALTYNRRRLLTRPTIVDNNMMAAIPDESQVDPLFFYYLLKQTDFNKVVAGTALPYINASDLAKMEVEVPPLAEQKAIAAVLGALDDKIELNRRMNATLEAMARALFQSWFVDFDPVRAKLDGRPPAALDPATAALFPEHLEDSPLGHIPKGWEVRTIESVCSTVTRGVTPEYGEGTGRFIINQRVNRGSDLDWSSLKELSQGLEVPPERFAKRWDVLVNCLGEGTLGRTHLYKGQSDIYAVDQHMSICRAEHPAGGAYIYQVLSGADGQAKIESLKTGSTGMTMFNISKLRTFELVWPSAEILAAYFMTVEPLWLQIANNDQESRTLATLRDTLLPKLLSGELNVNPQTD